MKKVFTLIKIALVVLALFFSVTVATYAYYEYYGKYSNVINITGTIKLDAFDVLYPTLREDGTYGITPENPYVIDNVARLQNLIQLNNSGKLKKYKEDYYKKYGITIDKFYFCLEFDAQQIPQILDLANEGLFESVGNNDYPFEDELAGIVYGYELTSGNIVYLSGCLPKVQIKVENDLVYVNGLADSSLNAADFTNGIYLKAERLYDATAFNPSNPDSIVFDANSSTTYISIKDVTPIHQVIANEQITVPIEQIDVGFISKIASNASVHDLILYNISINCIEDVQGSTHNLLKELFALLEGHHFADTENHSDEKHIGIFAGHIDGNASDISVGGTSTINIDTPEVNYYSNYMTVGYIYDFATIGGVTFNTLQQDSFLEGGSVSGCLFADDIYASVADDAEFSTADGAKHYALVNISSNTTHGWPGVANGQFSYGSFMFLLSSNDDTVTNIWNGNNAYKLLNDEGYTITGSVLFCADEYRYSPDQQAGGSIIPSSASVKEMLFNGISSLKATGSVIDAGKYLIVAKVADNSRDGGYAYYAIKLKASDDGTGNAVYTLDATSSADVTEFILDDSGTVSLYQSALWNVDVASTTPVFENCRYEDIWLNRDENGLGFGAYSGDENDHLFQYSAANNHLYYNVTTGEVTTQYYVAYDDATGEWAITSDVADAATIEMYHVADGYYVNLVTSVSDIEENGDYVIVARSGSTSYLLGIDNTDGIISDSFAHVDKEFTTASFPSLITLSEYEAMRNYVWNVQSASNGVASFVDKASLTYYLTTNDGALDLSTTSANWTYAQLATGGTLTNSNLYLNYSHNSESLTTCFSVGSSSYTIYLYRLEPVDDTPLYITYEGAKYLDADSSPIDAGTYAIIGVNGNNYYALGLNNTNNVVSTATNVNGASTLTNYYHWTVAEQTSTPTFRNEQSTGRFLNHNGTTINSATTSVTWMYDSQNYRVYYKNGDTTYYLTTNNAGTFSLQTSLGVAGYSYDVRLYKCSTEHQFSGVSIATEFIDGNYYLVSYADLSDTSKSQFLVGYRNEGGSQVLDRYNFSDKYTITGTINNNSNATITTTADMMNYAWLSIENNNGTAQRPEYYYYLYNAGYYNEHGSNLYLGCSSTGGSRTLIITDVAAYRVSGVNSGISVDTTHLNSPVYSGLRIAIRGTSYYYFLTSKNIEGEFELISTQNTANFADNRYNSEVLPTYIYQATGVTNTPVLELVSSNGDSLDQNIHYMITAEDNSGAATQYYALAMEEDDENNITFKGENVTSQVEMIMGYGDAGYKGSTNVPTNADWTQKSDSYELRFYHTATSSNSEQNYISRSGANLVMDLRASTAAITDVSKFYYDIVNKVMKLDVDSTTYYLTYDSSTKQFGISTNDADKATIHLIRYTPTYKVEVVTDYADGALKDGSFIIAGHSINGYFAIGTNGTAIDYGFNITNYLNEDLSEEDYKSILQYIFKQLYYDYHPDVSYDANVSSGYVDFQIMTLQNTGSFAPIGRTNANYETYSSAYTWRLTKTDDGLWKFVNHQTIGDTPNNSYGLTFNNGGGSSSLKLNDLVPQIDSYIGQYDISTSFTNGSNIYVYSPETGERYTQAITSGSQYLLVAEVRGLKFIIGNNNGNILVSIYDSAVLATYNTNSKYLWTISEYQEGYSLVNDGYYAYANATGTMLANNGSIDGCFIITSGAIAYRQYTYYYAYSSTNNTLAVSQGDTYWTKICRYVIDGTNCKFYPVSNSEIETYQNSLVLVSKNGANYYLLNIGGNNISRSAALADETDYYQIALGSIILDEYKVEVIDGANEFEYSVRAANTFFVYSNNTNTLTLSTNKSYSTKICRYVLEGGYYKFYPVTSSADITTYASSLVLVSKNVNTYNLVNIGSPTVSASANLTNSGTDYQIAEGNIIIDEYLVEVNAGNGTDEYSVRAQNTLYVYSDSDNTLALTSNASYWTKLYRYVTSGNSYRLYPVSTSEINTYANTLVLVSRNGSNYYMLDLGGTSVTRSATLTDSGTYLEISTSDAYIEDYLVNVAAGAGGTYTIRSPRKFKPSRNGTGNSMNLQSDETHWTKLYACSDDNPTGNVSHTIIPISIDDYATYSGRIILINRNGDTYYMVYLYNSTQFSSAITPNNDGTFTTSGNLRNYITNISAQNGLYRFQGNRRSYYLTMSATTVETNNRNGTYLHYSDKNGIYFKDTTNYYYLSTTATSATTTTTNSTVSYNDTNGIYFDSPYYYLSVNNTAAVTTTTNSSITYSFDNGIYYKNNYYYLTTSTTAAGRSTTSSLVRSEDGRGIHTRTTANYNTGLECDTFFSAETEEARGAMVVIFEHENGVYTQLVGDLVQGKQYIIAVKGNDNIYSFIGYDATNGVLRLTAVGSTITDFEGLVNASHLIDAYSSGNYGVSLRFHNDTTKYLSIINDNFGVSSTVNYWEYYWTGVYTDESRLYTVSSSNVSKVFTVSGNRIIPQVSGAETYLFNYEGTGTENDPYKITTAVTAALANRNYVIIIYQDSKYYVVANNDGEIVPVSSGSGFPSTISSNMIWTYSTTGYFKPMGEAGAKYLRTGRNGALTLLDNYTNSSWSYTYSASSSASFASRASSAANTTPVYLFKVSMNDSLDAISDTYTTLKGKSIVNASLSVLSSSNYIITATYNGKVYALGMKNLQESMALDITETFNEAISGGYIRIFSPSVWEQMGTDYNLIFNSLGFSGEQVNLLSGSRANVFEGSPTVVQFEDTPSDTEPYVWTLYTYGDNDYVLGNYDSGYLDTSFIYFDTEELMFKVTQNEATAKAGGSKVSIYQLGSEVRGSDAIEFQTFMIKLKEDNVTIESYPLNEIEAKDITKYSEQTLNGTIGGVIDGEYMIAAKANGRYYALTLDYSGNLQASDISLLFSGNFSTDEQGKYCISINTRYLWKQTGTVSFDQATGVASNLTFVNYNTNTALDLDATSLSYGNGQLYSASKHLNFSVAGGFTLGAGNSSVEIIIYSVGAGSVVIGDDSNELSYAYYSSALNTNALDFSDFTFQKVLIPNLQKYAKDATGSLTVTDGWNLTATTYLEEVNSSVYFSNGINYSSNVSTFANEFINIEYVYDVTDDETQEVTSYTVDYYAPKGVASFVISEASLDMPTFVNVIVSTQLDGDFNSEALRYLAVWKAADLVDNELVPLETSEGGASDYAATLINKFYKPDNAIPLPNHLGSVASGASYVKVQEDEETTAVYNLSQDANWNHLVAHTFCITSPGVYYIGSTYGTISFSYISIGNMLAAEEGEVNEEALGDGFSIDFVWGSIPSTSANVSFNDDSGVSDLTYVSRVTQNDESKTWVHSNIYPKFVNGTAGLYDEAKPEDYNPTDYLTITVNRDYTIDGNIEYSTVHINAVTNLAIHNEGNGIVYSNINNTHQRVKRKVEFHVSCVDGEVEPNGD